MKNGNVAIGFFICILLLLTLYSRTVAHPNPAFQAAGSDTAILDAEHLHASAWNPYAIASCVICLYICCVFIDIRLAKVCRKPRNKASKKKYRQRPPPEDQTQIDPGRDRRIPATLRSGGRRRFSVP